MDVGLGDTSGAEDGGSVDGDTGDPNPFLHNLEPDDELNATTSVELARADASEHGPVRGARCSLAFELGDVTDVLEFGFGPAHILAGFATETAQDVATFFLAADLDQPTWRFGEDPDNAKEKDKGDNLEGNRESPDERAVATLVEGATIFEPVSDDDTEDVEGEFNGDELSARFMFGGFGGPDGNNSVQDTSSPSVDEASEDHPGVVHGRGLKSGAEDGPGSTERDGLNTAILVAKPTADQAPNQSANIVDGDDTSLEKGVIDDRTPIIALMPKVHCMGIIIFGAIHAAHHTYKRIRACHELEFPHH